jgi:hypothetical protein
VFLQRLDSMVVTGGDGKTCRCCHDEKISTNTHARLP